MADVFHSTLDSLPHAVTVWRLDQDAEPPLRLVATNAAGARLEPTIAEHVGGPLSEAWPQLAQTSLPAAIVDVITSGRPPELGAMVIADRTYGLEVWPVADGHAGVLARRLQPREEAEAQIVASNEDVLWIRDARTQVVVYLSPSFERMFGVSPEQVYADPAAWRAMVHPEDAALVAALVATADPQGYTVEYRLLHPDGSVRWIYTRARTMHSRDGSPHRVVGTTTDITERKRTELELRRSQEDLESFAYVASHDLRSPLRGIGSLVRWIHEDAGDANEVRAHAALLSARVLRMERLLDGLLAFARIGRRPQPLQRARMGVLVAEETEILERPAGIEVTYVSPPLEVETEVAALRQVLHQLLDNAVKHHDHAHGRVEIGARTDVDGALVLRVTDDGPGIPPAYHERVFRMFETLRPRDDVEGSGMGLALVRRLARHRGGDATLTSSGRGTAITVRWPLVTRRGAH